MSKDKSADTRSVSTDALAVLGTILDDQQKRDAIHLAVLPVIAGVRLRPGEHIKLVDGQAFRGGRDSIGIVDPFLPSDVEPGQRFFLVIYPRVITSLRHVWSHPNVPDELAAGQVESRLPATKSQKEVSESWLRQYAARVNHYLEPDDAYKRLMRDIEDKAITYQGTDMHSLGDLQDADELQYHATIVLGKPVIWGEFEYFSCTC